MASRKQQPEAVTTLERGDIWFFFRPRVEEEDPEELGDVQNLFVVLGPRTDRSAID